MGSFIGHVVPGTFFFLFSLWWMYNVLYRYFYARRFNSSYRNTSSFPIHACKQPNYPLESMLKVIAAAIGMLGEFFTGFEDGKFTHIGNAQHMTMFFFFGLNGAVDLAYWKKWPIPPKVDYVSAIFAFAVEAFLFYNHLHGRSHMDIQVHMFLFYTIMCCLLFTCIEMAFLNQVLGALGRTMFTLLQGSWFYQIGFILYPPFSWMTGWIEEDHGQMMIVTLIYTWHLAAVLILTSLLAFLVWCRVQQSDQPKTLYQMVESDDKTVLRNGHAKPNGSVVSLQIDDSESEQEA